jgi:hypothetical protein
MGSSSKKYDAFVCYASEDKDEVATPLAEQLKTHHGLDIWFYDFSVHLGDSESQRIDEGLTNSKHGIVILSKNFFKKKKLWPKAELYALMTRHITSKKGVILPILHNISKREVAKYSAELAGLAELKTSEGIPTISDKLNREIRGIRTIYDFKSDKKLSSTISKLSNSIQAKKSLLEVEEEEMQYIILTKIYLIAKGYRMAYIYHHQFSDSLTSGKEEIGRRIEKCIKVLIRKKFITSKAWGTISITQAGNKEIEDLIEESFQKKSSTSDKKRIASQLKHSIGENGLSEIREIQKLRYNILKRASFLHEQKDEPMNIFTIGQPLGIEKEKLDIIYFYLVDEGLIEFYALGGSFHITPKGRKRVKDSPGRIF